MEEVADEVVHIGFEHTIDLFAGAAFAGFPVAAHDDLFQLVHLIGAVGQRHLEAHFDPGPTVRVVRGGDTGHGRNTKVEGTEIGHRRDARADILDRDARLDKPEDQRVLDGQRIVPVIVADADHGVEPATMHLRAQTQTQRGNAGQVHGLGVLPARIIFAEARRRDHRIAQEFPCVGRNCRSRFGHENLLHDLDLD